jgi:acyl dehydratase
MTEPSKTEYYQLTVGFEFPAQRYTLDQFSIALYLEATQETAVLFSREACVPPMAVTAFAMAALSQSVSMPSGTIHVSQELDFKNPVKVNDVILCCSKVARKIERGGLRLMNIDISVTNQDNVTVLTGKVGFVLPEPGKGT